MGGGGLARSIASEWASFEQMGGISPETTAIERADMRMVFYAGFRTCFRIMDSAIIDIEDVGFAELVKWTGNIADELERFRQEIVALAEKRGQ